MRTHHARGCARGAQSACAWTGPDLRCASWITFGVLFCFRSFFFFFFIYSCLRESPGCRFEKRDVFSKDFTFLKKQSAFGLTVTFHPVGWEVADKMAAAAAAGRVGGRRSSCWGSPGQEGAQPGATSVRPSRGWPLAASPLPRPGVLSARSCCARPAAPQPSPRSALH